MRYTDIERYKIDFKSYCCTSNIVRYLCLDYKINLLAKAFNNNIH